MSDRQVISTTGRAIEEAAIQQLAASMRSKLLRPGDEGYESARRVRNWAIDRHPGLIVCCAGVADVIRAVEFARTHDLLVAVRGGSHSFSGHSVCDGGIVIDLSSMKGIQVDAVRRTARAEAGLTVEDFDKATQACGLATTMGVCPTVGIAGFTLGGGEGWLEGKYRTACDNLLSVEIVTADGRLVTARAGENEDLFWGIRGGGGNFGVATSFAYQLYPVTQVLGGGLQYQMSEAREALRFLREYATGMPDELALIAGILPLREGPSFDIGVCYCGELQAGEKLLRPLRSFGRPTADSIQALPYLATHSSEAPPLERLSSHRKAGFFQSLTDEAIDAIVEFTAKRPSPLSGISLWYVHGARCQVDPAMTAYRLREVGYEYWIQSYWQDEGEAQAVVEWVNNFWAALQPFSSGAVYVNYLEDEGEERVKAAYGANHARLVALKNTYDPTNFFRLNQNIKPMK